MDNMGSEAVDQAMERLLQAAESLERAAESLSERGAAVAAEAQESVGRIVATVESAREAELERRLEEAERIIADLRAEATSAQAAAGRKTIATAMLAKSGAPVDGLHAGAVDAALTSLSVEQRIAVKAELLRAGLL